MDDERHTRRADFSVRTIDPIARPRRQASGADNVNWVLVAVETAENGIPRPGPDAVVVNRPRPIT